MSIEKRTAAIRNILKTRCLNAAETEHLLAVLEAVKVYRYTSEYTYWVFLAVNQEEAIAFVKSKIIQLSSPTTVFDPRNLHCTPQDDWFVFANE